MNQSSNYKWEQSQDAEQFENLLDEINLNESSIKMCVSG